MRLKLLSIVLAALMLVCAGGALVSAVAKPQTHPARATTVQGASSQVKHSAVTDSVGVERDYVAEPNSETSKSKSGSGHEEADTMPVHQRTWTARPFQLTPSGAAPDDSKQKSDGH